MLQAWCILECGHDHLTPLFKVIAFSLDFLKIKTQMSLKRICSMGWPWLSLQVNLQEAIPVSEQGPPCLWISPNDYALCPRSLYPDLSSLSLLPTVFFVISTFSFFPSLSVSSEIYFLSIAFITIVSLLYLCNYWFFYALRRTVSCIMRETVCFTDVISQHLTVS